MSYFLTDQKLEIGKEYLLAGEEAGHILLSRRIKRGERIALQGLGEKRYNAEIVSSGKKELTFKILNQAVTPPEPEVKITLFQAVVNEKAWDFVLQKSTELGAHKIVVFNSSNVANKLSIDQFNKKLPRWQKILQEAAKQCDRVKTPSLGYLSSVGDIVASALSFDKLILLDPSGEKVGNLVHSFKSFKSCSIIVGPEGGFTQKEVEKFKSLPNCTPVSLGPILLRAETAALSGLAVLQNLI